MRLSDVEGRPDGKRLARRRRQEIAGVGALACCRHRTRSGEWLEVEPILIGSLPYRGQTGHMFLVRPLPECEARRAGAIAAEVPLPR